MMAKQILRRLILTNRKLLSGELVSQRSLAVRKNLFALLEDAPELSTIHTFLPIKRNGEVDTWPIIKDFRRNGSRIVVSRTNFHDETMEHYLISEDTHFVEDDFQIPTPVNAQVFDVREVEVVLVPLLASDRSGGRIGYGKGYYDRLLNQMPAKVLKIGLNLAPSFNAFSFLEQHDQRMDYCITPFEIIDCKHVSNT